MSPSLARAILYAFPTGLAGALLGASFWQVWGIVIASEIFAHLATAILPMQRRKQ